MADGMLTMPSANGHKTIASQIIRAMNGEDTSSTMGGLVNRLVDATIDLYHLTREFLRKPTDASGQEKKIINPDSYLVFGDDITTGSALGHAWGAEQRVEATCTEDGYILQECTNNCGEEKRQTLPATGHSFGPWQDGTTVCGNADCGISVSAADLKITKQYTSEAAHYIIEVGTDAVPAVLIYHVVDNRAEQLRTDHPLTICYDTATGFAVTFEKAAGGEETKTLAALEGGSLQIEDSAPSTETPPEGSETQTPGDTGNESAEDTQQ
jgi:hypothetical protein